MDVQKSHLYTDNNDRRLKTIEQHRSEQDQTLQRIISTSPVKFTTGKYNTEPLDNPNQLNSLNQVKRLFEYSNPLKKRLSIQTSKISQHRRNKTEISPIHKNRQKDPVYNALFVPFLQTKSYGFGGSQEGKDQKTSKKKAISNRKSQSHSVSDQVLTLNLNSQSNREKKVSLPGISERKTISSQIQINQYKKSPLRAVKVSPTLNLTLNLQSRQLVQKAKNEPEKPFIAPNSIGKVVNKQAQKKQTIRLPIQARNLRDFKAKDRQNKLNSRRKNTKQRQWKQVNYLQLKTCYRQIQKKIASTSAITINSNIKVQPDKNKDAQLKGLKKDLVLHERMPKVPKLPQIIEEVSLIIKNYHSIRKNKISIEKLIKSKQFAVKFVQKQFLYFGQLKNQKFNGYGILIKPDYLFQGQWKEGQKITGAQSKKGIFFEGEFHQNKKIGFGVSYWNNGYDQYSGEWKDGLKNGNGVWKNLDGDQYIGQWFNGKVEGFGVHTTVDRQKYEGFFTNFLKQGKGKQSFANGDEYEGNFYEGKPSGYGVYKFYRTQAVYEGNFQKGLRHGQGKLRVPNNFEYTGQFKQDSVTGYGKVTYINNDCYIGNFKEGVRHGKGSLHKVKQRAILNGYWKNGEFFEKEG